MHAQSDMVWQRTFGLNSPGLLQSSYEERVRINSVKLEELILRLGSLAAGIQDLQNAQRIADGKKALAIIQATSTQMDLLAKAATNTDYKDSKVLEGIESKTTALDSQARDFGDELLAQEQDQEFEYERASDFFDEASYVLYIFGWSLALIGKLYDDRASEGRLVGYV